MKKKPYQKSLLISFILFPVALGSISGFVSGNMALSYSTLSKPAFSPAGIAFPVVWTILYILMGISSYLISQSNHPRKKSALTVYIIQLLFNFLWSILFFHFEAYLLAFFWLLAMIILIRIMIIKFYRIRPVAAFIQIPYLLWCLFAAVLNFCIYRLNLPT